MIQMSSILDKSLSFTTRVEDIAIIVIEFHHHKWNKGCYLSNYYSEIVTATKALYLEPKCLFLSLTYILFEIISIYGSYYIFIIIR